MRDHADRYLEALQKALDGLSRDSIEALAASLFRAYRNDKQVFTVGNGGSSSLASHMAADLAKNTIGPNMRRFRITSLTENASITTALANDLGYEHIFSEQLASLIGAGDVLIVVSASGNSPNVVKAVEHAQAQSAEVAALLGFDGGRVAEMADIAIVVPSHHYGIVEDAHLSVNHILVDYFQGRLQEARPWVV